MGYMKKLLGVALVLVPAAANAQTQCIAPGANIDVCHEAAQMQAALAPTLPSRKNEYITLINVSAFGPRITIGGRFEMTKDQVDKGRTAKSVSESKLQADIQTMSQKFICASSESASFVRLGGQISFAFRTSDGYPLSEALVSHCDY